jgi:uncharacterized surface protein with fasciclin (FAS1) repeats
MKKILFSFILTVMSLVSFSQTVVDIIVNSADHDTLEAAVVAAELADDLSGPGPFTVFAPTDAAFAALPDGTIETLLSDPTGALAQILLYHVVGGQALSTDLSDGQTITTLLGEDITVTIGMNGVMINNATVVVADILADNGVVHVIDAVLLPPSPQPTTVVDIIVNSDVHNTLEAAVVAAGLVETLSGTGPFTVFAPTDAAFAALPAGTVETLLADPTGTLTDILLYHVVGAQALSTDLTNGQTVTTLQGQAVTVTINADGVFINNAQVTVADIVTDNGVIHVIDAVLLPEQPNSVSTIETTKLKIQNPVAENIIIPSNGNSNVQIFSTTGQVVYSQNFNGSIDIDTRNLSSGTYLLKVEAENLNGVTKIVK